MKFTSIRILQSSVFSVLLLLGIGLNPSNLQAQTAPSESLIIEIQDDQGAQLPCRIHLSSSAGKKINTQRYPSWRDHFVCDGKAELKLSPGRYNYLIEKGPEYESLKGHIQIEAGKKNSHTFTLKRISHLRKEGWYSADLHVHRPVRDVEILMRAEDLDFAPVITWWNRQNPWKNNPIPKDRTVRFDGSRIYTILGGEDERQGGALLYFGLNQPIEITRAQREYPSPLDFVSKARQQEPSVWIDIEKPFWWDVPTWLASQKMNSIGIANNHMCHSQMLPNEAWGKPRDRDRLPAPLGNGYWTQEIYYHVLNAGLRLPPSAGSASGVLPNPVGYNRVYAYLGDRPFTRKNWFQALAKGKVFVTNGPLLKVRANRTLPGSTLKLSGEKKLEIDLEIQLTSKDKIQAIEVIHNGQVIETIPCQKKQSQSLSAKIKIDQSGWFLLRAIADVKNTFRFASTAPWTIASPDGTPWVSAESCDFFLQWIDERIEVVKKNLKNKKQQKTVLIHHQNAIQFWSEQKKKANPKIQALPPIAKTSERLTKFPTLQEVEAQPLLAATQRLVQALDHIGSPIDKKVRADLKSLSTLKDSKALTSRVQEILDPLCLLTLEVSEGRAPHVYKSPEVPVLHEQGWKTFLVKVVNPTGRTGEVLIESPNSKPVPNAKADEVATRWLDLSYFQGQPLKPNLSGLELEYRILEIYSRDRGSKKALFEFAITGEALDSKEVVKKWSFENGRDGWRPQNQIELEVKNGSLHITSLGEDPFMGAKVQSKAGRYVCRFWGKTESDGVAQFFWWTEERPQADGSRTHTFVVQPGKETLYEIPFTSEGELAGIRIDPLVKKGKFRIDWIDLISNERSKNWAKVQLDFECKPSYPVKFKVLNSEGKPAMGRFEITDQRGRVYPAQSKRLAPDFFFQRQIYRQDGEVLSLPEGTYNVLCSRGPESVPQLKKLEVHGGPTTLEYRVQRWVDPSKDGWWSGDHHIHAAGCLHYNNPTEGVFPIDMMRHIQGEDLKVGCCLTWGPCFDFQKRFFTGKVAEQSQYPYLLRYDVEVSGFGSHQSGHLNLLNLQEQIYPGGKSKHHWPTLGLNTLRWAKKQGAICGPAHSASGLTRTIGRVSGTEGKDGPFNLPNFNIPAYDGIGANEFIMNVAHKVPGPDGKLVPAVDFISAMDTQRVAEWNMWYHVLNCGFRVRVSGETDFPCISGERVGMGRVYCQVDGKLTFEKWVHSLGNGRSYVSDGTVHLLNLSAKKVGAEERVHMGRGKSELRIKKGQKIKIHLEAAGRRESSGDLLIECIVNGYPLAKKTISADGKRQELTFDLQLEQSSWVAIRAFPNAHTNPIFIVVDEKPIRASVDSARWCLQGVEQCWKKKVHTYRQDERAQAEKDYEHARKVFKRIIGESR